MPLSFAGGVAKRCSRGAGTPGGKVGANGAAYVFVKPGTGWANATQTAKLRASDGAVGDELGYSVAVSGAWACGGGKYAAASSYRIARNESERLFQHRHHSAPPFP
jgi:FG-GAP repeat